MSSNPDKPIVAVTASKAKYAEPYTACVERAGGEPWVVLPDHGVAPQEVLDRAQALVLSGGADIHPSNYGGTLGADEKLLLNPERDEMEIALAREALDADLPIYGICRGMQILNVAMGGSLIRDLAAHAVTAGESVYHRIYIAPGSKLAAVVGSGGFVRVNSRHRHGARDAHKSRSLLASAYSLEDGIIEALESPDHRWVIGVQFHPERRLEVPPHFDRLFQSLVERAAERLEAVQKG